jgi:purine-nucleoside/S-methyl-5'-thioadenosine phosphorylase / adenosine deaminase
MQVMVEAIRTGIDWLACHPANIRVVAGCTTRLKGFSSGPYARGNLGLHVFDDPVAVGRNRQALSQYLGARHVQWLQQVHGTEVHQATYASAAQAVTADAVWTHEVGLALAILTADCVPVLLWSASEAQAEVPVVAGIHAGWRGLCDGVIAQTLRQLPVPSQTLQAWIGPCISAAHYEVGEEVWSQFTHWPEAVTLPHPDQQQKRLLDLNAGVHWQLQACGVTKIHNSRVCTYVDPRFYSHRGRALESSCGSNRSLEATQTGRFASVIMLRG